jgi:hypothetical protein
MVKFSAVAMALVLVSACGVRAQSPADSASETTVCQLQAGAPAARRVHMTAVAIQDPRHGARLIDPSCKGVNVGFRFADGLDAASKAKQFDAALSGDPMDLTLRIFTVTLSGLFDPKATGNPHGLLTVDRVQTFAKQSDFPDQLPAH